MAEIHERKINESRLDTVLAEDISFEGELSFTKELMIKGSFSGKINAGGDLYIAENAVVEADINAASVFVKGRVKGSIVASTRVELQGNAEVEGDITAPKIVMDTGCRFDGISRMKPLRSNEK